MNERGIIMITGFRHYCILSLTLDRGGVESFLLNRAAAADDKSLAKVSGGRTDGGAPSKVDRATVDKPITGPLYCFIQDATGSG